jgi:hypothetical protein
MLGDATQGIGVLYLADDARFQAQPLKLMIRAKLPGKRPKRVSVSQIK